MPDLTDNEARALLYFAVGVAAEGRDRAYELRFDGRELLNARGQPELEPRSNRGYSIGTLRNELSQGDGVVATRLVDACHQWTMEQFPRWSTGARIIDASFGTGQRAKAIADLCRNGDQIRGDHGRDLDPAIKAYLTRFLSSHTGQDFVHKLDAERVAQLMEDVVAPLCSSELYRSASGDDQVRLIAVTANACGKNQTLAETLPGRIRSGRLRSLSDVRDEIERTEPDLLPTHRAAQAGAGVFHALQLATADHPLYEPWRKIVADPLINHRLAGSDTASPHIARQYQVITDLFAAPLRGKCMLDELNGHGSHADGRPDLTCGRGYYAQGRDFLTWDRTGRGRAFVNGQWRDFERGDLSLASNANGTLDLHLRHQGHDEVLLHVTHSEYMFERPTHAADGYLRYGGMLREGDLGASVRGLQRQLTDLGYHNADGGPLNHDGIFGPNTRAALEAFQRDRHLDVDGMAGRNTFIAIHRAFQERAERPLADASHPGNYMYNRALMALQESDDWRESEERTSRLAAAAAITARGAGFTTIDRVAFDAHGPTAYFEQGDRHSPVRRQVEVDVRAALRTPAADRAADWYRAERYQALAAAGNEQAVRPRLPRM